MPDEQVPSRARTLVLDAVLVAAAALLILVPVLELWEADLGVPFAYVRGDAGVYAFEPDAPFYQMLVKGGMDNLWFFTNSRLGAPFHQQLFDFPVGLDNLNLLNLKLLGAITGSVGTTVNLFYLLTFVTVPVTTMLVLRALGVSRLVAAVVALLYTFLPYHFARGVPHLFLSAYWVVPLGAYLVLRVASDRPPFTTDAPTVRGWRVRLADRAAVLWLLACVAIGSSGAYYAAFTLLFLVVLTAVDVTVRRRWRVLASGALAIAAIGAVALVNAAPSLVYRIANGENTAVVRRHPSETEFEGLKLSQLLLPVEQHRLAAFADVQTKSTRYTPTRSEAGQQLGAIGALGFLALLVWVLLALRRPWRAPPAGSGSRPVPSRAEVMSGMGVLTITGVVMATISGFSLLVFVGFRELRSWNRMSVFLAFFAFTVVAFGLDWLRARLPARPWTGPAFVAGLAVLLVLGILDQVSPAVIPDYRTVAARWDSDAAFVHRIERRLPDGAEVFVLPYRYFPEAPVVGTIGPYDLARPYLHSDSLRWSWGGMLGREADWQASSAYLPAAQMLDRVAAVGFDGVVYDLGSTYRAREPSPDDITAALGEEPLVSADGELAFWDLRRHARQLRARIGDDGVRALRAWALHDRSQPPS